MKIEMARSIAESLRHEMTAEALALAYDTSTTLGKREVLEAIAATLDSIGNPLEKVWIEDVTGKRRTYTLAQARTVFGDRAWFRYLWAIPRSERRNSKERWLTTVTVDNTAAHGATLFFALPRGVAQEFGPHLTLLMLLAKADIVPQYGFGYMRAYGGPDYFALGYVNKSGRKVIDQPDWVGLSPLSEARAGNPAEHPDRYRYARSPIKDVFPMNVLSDVHLQQRLGDESFKEWIVRNTGPDSLRQVGPRCFAWLVSAAQTHSLTTELKGVRHTTRPRSAAAVWTVSRLRSSDRHQS